MHLVRTSPRPGTGAEKAPLTLGVWALALSRKRPPVDGPDLSSYVDQMNTLRLEADWEPRQGYALTDSEQATHRARMGSQVWRHPRLVRAVVPDPSPQADEVVVRVAAAGVCGSDTHCYETDAEGYILFSGPVAAPCVLGHEYAGEVVAVGRAVRSLRVGDWVTAEGMQHCGVCEACRKGLPNQCANLEMTGFTAPGAYAEAIAVREKLCWRIDALAQRLGSAAAAAELAALVEPVACSYNGLFVAGGGMPPGSHVAVFGCGPIGLGAIALCRAAGAAAILAFDTEPARLEVAKTLGADQAWNVRAMAGSPAEAVLAATKGWGADRVVEAAGAALQTMPQIERCLAPGGRMIYLGRTGLRAPVLLDVLVSGASGICGARGHAGGGCFPNILRLMAAGRLDLAPMITARMPLAAAHEAVVRSSSRQDAKIMLIGEQAQAARCAAEESP